MSIHYFRSSWLPVLAWAILILLVSSIPRPLEVAPSDTASFLQNFSFLGVGGVTLVSFIIHFVLYAVLGFLVGRSLAGSEQFTPAFFFLALALCTAFGFLDELYQELIPGRGFECIDILANSLGSGAGLLVFAKLSECKKTGDGSPDTGKFIPNS